MITDLDLYLRGEKRPRICVSGPMAKAPYTGPRAAFLLAQRLWKAGWHPIVPHGCAMFETITGPLDPASEDGIGGWLEYDFSMMVDCVAIVRVTSGGMEGVASSGADREFALADKLNLLALSEEEALLGPEACFVRADVGAIDLHEAADVALEAMQEIDDVLRKHRPHFDHSRSAVERLERVFSDLAAERDHHAYINQGNGTK